eukprot:1157785_1
MDLVVPAILWISVLIPIPIILATTTGQDGGETTRFLERVEKFSCSDNGERKQIPAGAPVLFLGPAPTSEFEKSLHFPGLRGLFRRNSTVHYANHLGLKRG